MITYLRRHHAGLLALFVALGGTSYAAATVGSQDIQSRAVETRHLDRGAVTTAKVRDGSLLAADFRAGQLPAGPQGQPGPQGPAGDRGPVGPPGANATIAPNSLTGADINEATLGQVPNAATLGGVGAGGFVRSNRVHWVVVNPDGGITRQSGGFQVFKGPSVPGDYRVRLPNDVTVESCAWVAGLGDGVQTLNMPPAGEIAAGRAGGDAPRVDVIARDSAVNLADRPFHLLVVC